MTADSAGDLLLDVRDLSVDYGSEAEPLPAVSQVSLRLRRGEILGIAGRAAAARPPS